MTQNQRITATLLGAFTFVFLFHKHHPGLNLLFFELLYLTFILVVERPALSNLHGRMLFSGTLLSVIATVVTHSFFSYLINFFSILLFTGYLAYPEARSLVTTSALALYNTMGSPLMFLKSLSDVRWKGHRPGKVLWRFRIFFVPVIIIILFAFIYSVSNPIFNEMTIELERFIQKVIHKLLEYFDFTVLFTFIAGLIVSVYLVFRYMRKETVQYDVESQDEIQRRKTDRDRNFRMHSLLNEYRAGIFLLVVLNALIFILNIIDVYWVWFGFEWDGKYLKQFVHEGTYMLIFSILISIALVLYYFRGNLNFFKSNLLLKRLSYLWLLQNAVLVISVAMRNVHYIEYFALAYKRIGVFMFLGLTLFGLYSVYVKVKEGKSNFYLFRVNALSGYLVLLVASLINWDVLIAKYNFSHADRSFLHLDFMVTLSDKALPYLDVPLEKLQKIKQAQADQFNYREVYMSPEEYYQRIQERKAIFRDAFEKADFLEWNLADYLAYRKLFP